MCYALKGEEKNMPLKPKYSREEIIDAAFALAREKDMSAISARAVGKRLNVSSSPIFTVFECIEQLRAEVWKRAVAFFDERIQQACAAHPETSFITIGAETIKFAINEPNLFRILFVRQRPSPKHGNIIMTDSKAAAMATQAITNAYRIDGESAKKIYDRVWIYTFGTAIMSMTGMLSLNDEQVYDNLSRQYEANYLLIKKSS